MVATVCTTCEGVGESVSQPAIFWIAPAAIKGRRNKSDIG
jgi:hypothetical protein